MRDHCHNPSHSIKYYQSCSNILEQHSIYRKLSLPAKSTAKARTPCRLEKIDVVVNQTEGTYIVVRFMGYEVLFGIGPVSLLLLKSLHIQGASTHTQVKRETGYLNTPQLISMSNPKFMCTWLLQNNVITRKILCNFVYKWGLHKSSSR
jgi:hypothetical protein